MNEQLESQVKTTLEQPPHSAVASGHCRTVLSNKQKIRQEEYIKPKSGDQCVAIRVANGL